MPRSLLIACLLACSILKAQSTFYDLNTIQKVEVQFAQSNWDMMLDTAKAGADSYIMAQWVKVNGIQYDSVGVKYKGNSSYNSTNAKNPLHIALDEYKEQSYQSFTDIKLGNGYADPSMIREALSYNILKNYMDCPRANFAQLYINGAYIGVYTNDESINKQFCSDHFYSSKNTFIKCNPEVNPSPATKSNLRYIPAADSSGYFNFYDVKSTYGWNDLVKLCDTVTNTPANIGANIDMDRAIWMLAFNNVLVNLDSYSGVFCQNYYLYKDNTKHYNPIVWDLNMSLGGFPYAGNSNTSMGTLSIANMEQLSPTLHSTDSYWPLIKDVMANPMYKRMYIAHMRTISSEMFASGSYSTTAAQMQALIDTAVQSDANNFFTYAQFQSAMNTSIAAGSYSVPGISSLMTARVSYLQSTTDFSYSPPVITGVASSVSSPSIGAAVTVTANVTNTNASAVYLGYRYSNALKFTRVLMYDDGAHNDGAAGDNVYGIAFNMNSTQVQYYIYAENNNAGMFSPARAEHEFYTLNANIQTAAPGQVVINEFVASNQNGAVDDNSKHGDWIELYNKSNVALSVYGLYISDNFSNPTKFAMPPGFVIQPGGYLIVWADQDSTTSYYIHANFKLSGSGEQVMLSNSTGAILDSVTFSAQTTDQSMGRCPNGTGSFITFTSPTFNAINSCPLGIESEQADQQNMAVYPNPANDVLNVDIHGISKPEEIEVLHTYGAVVYKGIIDSHLSLDIQAWQPGLYMIRYRSAVKKILVTR